MKKVILLIFLFLCISGVVFSQASMSITVERNLTFEDVFGGQSKEVTVFDDKSALFRLDVRGNNTFRISFTLTSVLTNGAHTIPITYSTNNASWKINSNNPSGSTQFDPYGNFTVNVRNRDIIYVWIGGNINPAISAMHGNYSANIVISVERL